MTPTRKFVLTCGSIGFVIGLFLSVASPAHPIVLIAEHIGYAIPYALLGAGIGWALARLGKL